MSDNDNETAFETLMLRVHCRRIAGLCTATGRELPPGVKAHLASDSWEYIEADNAAYGDWCRSHGVEALAVSYPESNGKADPGPVVLDEL